MQAEWLLLCSNKFNSLDRRKKVLTLKAFGRILLTYFNLFQTFEVKPLCPKRMETKSHVFPNTSQKRNERTEAKFYEDVE